MSAQLVVDLAIEACCFEVDRPDTDVTQESVKVPPILLRTPDLLNSNFQLTQDWDAGCKTSPCKSPLLEPAPNKGIACDGLA